MSKFSNTIEYNIKTNLDSSGLLKLQQNLNQVNAEMAKMAQKGLVTPEATTKAIANVKQVQMALNKAFDINMNLLDVKKFSDSLSSINGLSLSGVQESLKEFPEAQKSLNGIIGTIGRIDTGFKNISSVTDKIMNTFGNTVRWGITASIFQTIQNSLYRSVDYVKDLDTSLNNIQIVTGASAENMRDFSLKANEAAANLGASTVSFTDAAQLYAQNGYDEEDYTKLAELTTKVANVTQQSTSDVSEQITSLMAGYKMSIDEAEDALSGMAVVAAESASDLGELANAEQKVASAANTLGVSQDQLTAQLSTIISVTRQAPEQVGNSLKTIYARLGDLQMGETLEDGVSLGDVSGSLEKVGVAVLDVNGDMRSMGDILEDLMAKWKDLSTAQQQALAVKLAGKYQYNNLMTLMSNSDMYEQQKSLSENASGALDEQQGIYMESLQAKIQKLQTTWEGFVTELVDSNNFKGAIDGFSSLISGATTLTETLGGLTPVLTLVSSLMLKSFSGQIAEGISNINLNMQRNALRGQNEQEILRIFGAKNNVPDGAASAMLHNTVGVRGNLKGKSAEEYNANLQTMVQADDAVADAQKELKAALAERKSLIARINESLSSESGLSDAVNEETGQINEQLEKTVAKVTEINKLQSINEQYTEEDSKILKEINWDKIKHLVNVDLAKEITSFQEEFESGELTFKQIKDRLSKIADAAVSEEEASTAKRVKSAEAQLKEQDTRTSSAQQAVDQATATRNDFKKQGEAYADRLKKQVNTQNIIEVTAAIGQLAFAWQSFQSLGSLWKDDDIATGDKITQTLMALSMALPTAYQGVKQLVTALLELKGLNATRLLSDLNLKELMSTVKNAISLFGTFRAGNFGVIKSLKLATYAASDFGASLVTLIGSIGPLVAALGAVAGAIALVQSHDNAIDDQIKKEKEQVEAATSAADKANDTVSSWQELADTYKSTGNASQEFINKSKEVAESLGVEGAKALEASGNYDKLTQSILAKQDAENQKAIDAAKNANQGGISTELSGGKYLTQDLKSQVVSALTQGGIDVSKYNSAIDQLDKTDIAGVLGFAHDTLQDLHEQITKMGSSYEEAQKNGFTGDKQNYENTLKILNNTVEKLNNVINQDSATTYTDNTKTASDYTVKLSSFQSQLNGLDNISDILSVYLNNPEISAYLKSIGASYEDMLKFVADTAQDTSTKIIAEGESARMQFAQEAYAVTKNRGGSEEEANAAGDEIYSELQDVGLTNEDVVNLRASIDYDTLKDNINTIIERLDNGDDLQDIIVDITADEDSEKSLEDQVKDLSGNVSKESILARDDIKEEDYQAYRQNALELNDNLKDYADQAAKAQSELNDQIANTKKELRATNQATDPDKYAVLTEQLKDLEKEYSSYDDAIDDAVAMQLECETGAQELQKSYDDWTETLQNSSKSSKNYNDALQEMSTSVGKFLNVDMSSWGGALKDTFITQNLQNIKAALDGDTDALANLQAQAQTTDIMIKLGLDPNDSDLYSQCYDAVQYAQSVLPNIEAGATIDDTQFQEVLTTMVNNAIAAGATVDDVLKQLQGMGIEAEVTDQYQEYTTTVHANHSVEDELLGVADQDVPVTVKVPVMKYKKTSDYTPTTYKPKYSGGGGGGSGSSSGKGNKGSGGSGSGSGKSYEPKTKDKQEDEYDRYEKVNAHLDRLSKILDKLSDAQDRLTGKKLVENMTQQANILEQQVKWQKEKLELQRQEASELQGKLAAYGVQFDTDGYISNYKDVYYDQLNKYNAAINAYNADGTESGQEAQDKVVEQAKKSYDDFKDLIDKYDDLRNSTIEESVKDIEDYYDKIEDLHIEAFKKSVEAVDNMKDMRETLIEFNAIFRSFAHDTDFDEPFNDMQTNAEKLKQYWDMDSDAMNSYYSQLISNNKEALSQQGLSAERKNWLISRNQMYENAKNQLGKGTLEAGGSGYLDMELKNLNDIMEQINQFEKTGASSIFGENSADLYDVAKDIFDSATSMVEDLKSEADDLKSNIIDGIDNIGDAIDKQLDKFDSINDTLEHYADMIEMISGDQAYDKLNSVYEAQIRNGQVELDTLKQSIEVLQDLQKEFEEGSDQWQEVADQISDKQSQVLDKTKDIMDLMNKVYSNNVSKQLDAWTKDTPLGADLDWLSDQWELINRNEDQYLDKTNSAYNIQKLQAKYLDLLDQSDNLLTQQKITDQMNQQLSLLRSKDKLSQYDVDYANAQLEILQKTIALQDAQNNKSQMKLRRDTQGNYSYVYTANEGDVKSAKSDLLDAQNNAYNLSKDNIKQTQDDSLSALQDAKSMISDIWTNANLTLEEKTERTKTIIDSLKQYLAGTADQLSESEQNIIQDFIGMCDMMTDENKAGLDDVYDQLISGNDEAFSQIDSRWGDSISQWLDNLDDFNAKTDETFGSLVDNAKDYADKTKELGDQVGLNFSDMTDVINAAKTATDDLANSTSGFIDKLEASSGVIKNYEKDLQKAKSQVLDLNNAMGEYQSKVNDLEGKLQAEERKNADLSDQLAASEAKYNAAYGKGNGNGNGGAGGVGGSSDDVAYGIAQSIWTYGKSSGWGNNPTRSDKLTSGYGSDFAQKVQDIINQKVWSGSASDLVNYDSMSYSSYNLLGYDTGGYTGTWSETEGLDSDAKNGKLAILHQKELVLNEADTANILKAVEYVREMAQSMSSNGIMADLSERYGAWSAEVSKMQQTLAEKSGNIDQTVNVNAEFPNATSAEEIKTALNDLASAAIQYTGKRIGRYGLN